jgi:pimeloyl-ACP methyl ester carboxylesterase
MKLATLGVIAIVGALAVAAAALWTPDRSRASLEAKYLRSPNDLIDVAGVRLHVRDDGPRDAPALIMIHGFGSSLQTWEPWARALAPAFRVIRFDLPGSGLSAPDSTGDYSDARSVALVLALMDRLHLQRATLVGNSIGGRIAWRFAAIYPDRVDKLVLISPDGFASPGYDYGKTPVVPATMGLMRYVLPKPLLKASLKPAYGDPSALLPETVTRYYDLMLAPGGRNALLERLKQGVLTDPRPLLHRIQAPVLLLWGERDGMIPIANARDYLQALPNARLVTYPRLGHVPQEEDPDGSIGALRTFLQGAGGVYPHPPPAPTT